MSGIWPYLAAIVPTIVVAIFFYFIVRTMLEGDRRERMAQKKYEQEQDALRPAGPASDVSLSADDSATAEGPVGSRSTDAASSPPEHTDLDGGAAENRGV